jgi:beta-glucosidase
MKFAILVLFVGLPLVAGFAADAQPGIERRIDDLISRMTLEEELGQMSQATLEPLTEERKSQIRSGRWGSLFGSGTPAERAEAQRIASESRLHIPLLLGLDVIHGQRTVLPIPLGQAASWDPEAVRAGARIAAREAAAEGVHWTFSPMVDIARDARWGRIAEGYGEDPYLAGTMAAAAVHGYQGNSLSAPDSIAACAKHFAGYGAAEAGRDYNATWIPELLLRDVYLRPFRAARDAGAASFMTAFNTLNGIPTTGNEFLLRQVLRGEWRYDGLVVSDYEAVKELVAHGYAADEKDAAFKAIRAGVDMEMVSATYWNNAKALLQAGRISQKQIDDAVRNILRIKFRLGLFDNRPQPAPASTPVPSADALDVANRLTSESLVLLKNEGILPLSRGVGKVAVIGALADSPEDQAGTWALSGVETMRTPLASLRQRLGQDRILWAQGLRSSKDTSRDGFPAAVAAARNADVVIMFMGEEASLSGEAASRAYLDLPGLQQALFDEIARTGKPIVTVIFAGRPTTFHDIAAKSRAVVYAWDPGTMGGPAITGALFGDSVPSGKLPVTFPRTVGQVPIYYDHLSSGRPAAETGPAAADKYRSKYLDVDFTPEYPFGYGLSYTNFEYSNIRASSPRVSTGAKFTVTADVTNTGRYEADEIVQFYTHELAASVARPVRELRGFERVHLKPGEKRAVSFTIGTGDLAFYNEKVQLVTEPGAFEAWIAPDSASGLKIAFEVTR